MKGLPNLATSSSRVTAGSPKQVEQTCMVTEPQYYPNARSNARASLPSICEDPRVDSSTYKQWSDPGEKRTELGEVRQFPDKTNISKSIGSADAS